MTKVWIVDAFTSKPYSGNPAAVMLVDEFPSDQTCLRVAAEINFSETAFVKPLTQNKFHLRWFTPKLEVKLCGHATLATAHVLYEQKKLIQDTVVFESLSGSLFVKKEQTGWTLDFPLQPVSQVSSIEVFRLMFPGFVDCVRAVDDLIVELDSERAVREFVPEFQRLIRLDCRALILTAKAAGSYDFVSRFFAPRVGINEDPVTGSAHCKLADYWQKRLDQTSFRAYQASERGGVIDLSIHGDRVHIKGEAVTLMEGVWRVPIFS